MYARMVTLYLKPEMVEEMNRIFQNKLLPLMENQSGFKGIFVMNNPGENKEVCITFWESMVDMETFNLHYLTMADEIVALLTAAPEVEILTVNIPVDITVPDIISMSESSLGIHIQNPFDFEYGLEKV